MEWLKRISLPMLIGGLALLTACQNQSPGQAQPVNDASAAALTVTSPDFSQGEPIPKKYTCQGENISPALAWSTPPAGAKSLALLVEDPDAPGGIWVHWIAYNIPPTASSLDEGASAAKAAKFNLPENTLQGKSSFNRADYGGPCPPFGIHRYFFRLYALDTSLNNPGMDKTALLKAIDGHILAKGELMGTYGK